MNKSQGNIFLDKQKQISMNLQNQTLQPNIENHSFNQLDPVVERSNI